MEELIVTIHSVLLENTKSAPTVMFIAKNFKDKNSTGASSPSCFTVALKGLSFHKSAIISDLHGVGEHRMG